MNDNVYGQAQVGAELGLDPAMFERVEIIRGPASSLYGDSAFFGVVNVITRSWELTGSVHNIFDAEYSDPVSTAGRHLAERPNRPGRTPLEAVGELKVAAVQPARRASVGRATN